jgi:hypothetical protein
MDRNDRDRPSPTEPPRERAAGGHEAGGHEAGGPGDGMRTGGSAGTASGHHPMPDEVEQLRRQAEPPSRDRTKGDGAGTV